MEKRNLTFIVLIRLIRIKQAVVVNLIVDVCWKKYKKQQQTKHKQVVSFDNIMKWR